MHHTHLALKHLFTDTEVYISTGAGSIDWNRSENNGTRHRTRAGKLYSCVNKLFWTCSLKRLAHVFKYHSTSEGCCTTKNLLTFVFPSANTVCINFRFFFSYNFIVQYIYVFVFADPKKIAYIQETVGETSSQSVVVAVDRWLPVHGFLYCRSDFLVNHF